MGGQEDSPTMEAQSPVDRSMRKRVCKACDRCRLKKSKCDGLSVCSRCRADNAICVFGERKKSYDKVYPKGYVEMLEQQQAQLVTGLQELYRRTQNGQGWEGTPLKESNQGMPLTHDILDSLGALKSGRADSAAEHFEEDLSSLQGRLLADGAEFMQRALSDSDSDSAHSSALDQKPPRIPFTNPFALSHLPPTPPTQSPFPRHAFPIPLLQSQRENGDGGGVPGQNAMDDGMLPRQTWASTGMPATSGLDLLKEYSSPVDLHSTANPFDATHMPAGTIAPYLSMRDWNHDVDFQRYFSSTAM